MASTCAEYIACKSQLVGNVRIPALICAISRNTVLAPVNLAALSAFFHCQRVSIHGAHFPHFPLSVGPMAPYQICAFACSALTACFALLISRMSHTINAGVKILFLKHEYNIFSCGNKDGMH